MKLSKAEEAAYILDRLKANDTLYTEIGKSTPSDVGKIVELHATSRQKQFIVAAVFNALEVDSKKLHETLENI